MLKITFISRAENKVCLKDIQQKKSEKELGKLYKRRLFWKWWKDQESLNTKDSIMKEKNLVTRKQWLQKGEYREQMSKTLE